MKRYEYWTREGKRFTDWFNWDCDEMPKTQLKGFLGNDLRNEYK